LRRITGSPALPVSRTGLRIHQPTAPNCPALGLTTGIHSVAFQGHAKIFKNILKDLPSANVLRDGHEKRVALKPDPVPEPR